MTLLLADYLSQVGICMAFSLIEQYESFYTVVGHSQEGSKYCLYLTLDLVQMLPDNAPRTIANFLPTSRCTSDSPIPHDAPPVSRLDGQAMVIKRFSGGITDIPLEVHCASNWLVWS